MRTMQFGFQSGQVVYQLDPYLANLLDITIQRLINYTPEAYLRTMIYTGKLVIKH